MEMVLAGQETCYTLSIATKVRIHSLSAHPTEQQLYHALLADRTLLDSVLRRELLWAVRNFLDNLLQHADLSPCDTELERLAAVLVAVEQGAVPTSDQISQMWDRIDTVINNTIDVTVGSSIDFVAGETR